MLLSRAFSGRFLCCDSRDRNIFLAKCKSESNNPENSFKFYFESKKIGTDKVMFNLAFFVIVLLIGVMDANAMSIKRSEKSENNLEKVDETEYPLKVNYDVYPVRSVRSRNHFASC